MIRIRDLRFSYGQSFQLAVEALDIAAGEKAAIVGRSGCGKTTLLNLVSGVTLPESGEIEINSTRMERLTDRERRRFRAENIGFVFQEFELVEYLSVRENILLPFRLHPNLASRDEIQVRLDHLLQATELWHRAEHFPSQLSQGQRQRTALCRALVTSPRLLLADEPTGNLDHETADNVLGVLFKQLDTADTTLLMVTHDRNQLARFDRIIDLDKASKPV